MGASSPGKDSIALFAAVLLTVIPAAVHPAPAGACTRGIVVESIQPRSDAEKAGLRTGDLLLAWGNPDRSAYPLQAPACFETFFGWVAFLEERSPVSDLRMMGTRGGEPISVALPQDFKGIFARPELPESQTDSYLRGLWCERAGEPWAAVSEWTRLLEDPALEGDPSIRLWLRMRIAEALVKGGAWGASATHWSEMEEAAERAGLPLARALALEGLARALEGMKRSDLAMVEQESARMIRQGAFGETLGLAGTLNTLGTLLRKRGDIQGALRCHELALSIRERLAPRSLAVGGSSLNLAIALQFTGDMDGAEELSRKALALFQERVPGGQEEFYAWVNLGALYIFRGDLAAAERSNRKAYDAARTWAPDGLNEAAALNNLAIVLDDRGNFAEAEEMYKRSLALRQKLSPGSLDEAQSLKNLGQLAAQRWNLDLARDSMERALAIHEKLAPESLQVADTLTNLGQIVADQGRIDEAASFYRKALSIQEKIAPGGIHASESLSHLGTVSMVRGDLQEAERLFSLALAIRERLAPGSLPMVKLLVSFGDLSRKANSWKRAETYYGRALDIASRLSPGGILEAQARHSIGTARLASGDAVGAAQAFSAAIQALESQAARLGGGRRTEEGFSAEYSDYYRDLVGVQISLKQGEEAFGTLERFRAQVLLRMLAERDLDFSKDAPEEFLREQKRLAFEREKVQGRMEDLSPEEDLEGIESCLRQLRQIHERQEAVEERIRKASPALASLQYPHPMGAGEIMAALDPGTLLLTWSVGRNASALFALDRDGLETFALPVSRRELEIQVRRFRKEVGDRTEVNSRQLADRLLGPARGRIAKARRLLIIPDGPLHFLPFAALPDPSARGCYLVERCPVHQAVSGTTYVQMRKTRRGKKETALVGFGAPEYAPHGEASERASRPQGAAPTLAPLPYAREELEAVGKLYRGTATLFLGEGATEEAAKAVGTGPTLIHFACHGTVDARFPLDSYLTLSTPPRKGEGLDNGLLQAWEIFEQMRIDADLVTLSACDTGLGKETGGEGLVGLTRAFQYAGAQSVLASLWSVSDESTANLMVRVYSHLKAGKSKDQALRLAQIEMIQSKAMDAVQPQSRPPSHPSSLIPRPDYSHPFYWAGFILNGDWR